MTNPNTKLLYYPIFPKINTPGSKRGNDVRYWVKKFLIPAGLATMNENEANAYLVVGGDGLIMKTVRAKAKENKIFVGVNRGTVGFMLNPIYQINEIPTTLAELNTFTVSLIEVIFTDLKGQEKHFYAFNDVICGGDIADFTYCDISGSLSHFPARKFSGNGVVVSTPQGTTGFALKARGTSALLTLDSNSWFISGIATGPYPCDQVTPQEITINLSSRDKVNGYADGKTQRVSGITKAIIKPTNITATLGFLTSFDFVARRTQLAQKVERGEI